MPIYTDKRTGNLFVQFDYKKQTIKRTLPPGSTRRDAQKLETKLRSDAFFQSHGMAPRDEILFEDCVQDYLAHIARHPGKYAKAEYVLIAAKPFLKNKTIRGIKPIDIERFIHCRQTQPSMHDRLRKPATIWREVAVLSALFSFAIKNDMCEVNPCTKVEKPKYDNIQTRILAREVEDRFLNNFDVAQGGVARDICILVLHTGLRQNDVLRLTAFQCHGGTISLTQGKTKRVVALPLNATAQAIIDKYRKGGGLLFPSPKTGKAMHYIRKAIAGACRRAKIEPVTIRDLRRTFATRLAEDGTDALTIALLLGHADLRMVHRYARSMDAMSTAVQKLDRTYPSSTRVQTRIG